MIRSLWSSYQIFYYLAYFRLIFGLNSAYIIFFDIYIYYSLTIFVTEDNIISNIKSINILALLLFSEFWEVIDKIGVDEEFGFCVWFIGKVLVIEFVVLFLLLFLLYLKLIY